MDYATGTLISSLISYYIPISNDMVKMQIGLLSNSIINSLINSKFHTKILKYFVKKNTHIVIESVYNNKLNPIYKKYEDYILDKYSKNLESCILVPKDGGIELLINKAIIAAINKTKPLAASNLKNHLNGFDKLLII